MIDSSDNYHLSYPKLLCLFHDLQEPNGRESDEEDMASFDAFDNDIRKLTRSFDELSQYLNEETLGLKTSIMKEAVRRAATEKREEKRSPGPNAPDLQETAESTDQIPIEFLAV